MEKIREWTPSEALEFKSRLRELVEKSGRTNATVAEIFGVSESRFNVWLDMRNQTMPMIPAYELISISCEFPLVFERLVERRQKFLGKSFRLKTSRGRKRKAKPSAAPSKNWNEVIQDLNEKAKPQ
jgi:hypothetical protein